ncbi:MAG: hypothetical protein HZB83_01715 [Deltaproteobacteria bacterium]|nr:hypothetical protein [Deltaproteobacteria bacterium]
MIGAVVVTHGTLSKSLVEAAGAITGAAGGIMTVSVSKADTTESIRADIGARVKEADSGKGVIIFTDMFGGTPTNVALSFLKEGSVEILTGVNLPLLIKFIGHRSDKALSELTLILKDYGQKSIVLAGDMLKEKG